MNWRSKAIVSAEIVFDTVCGIAVVIVMYVGLFLARLGKMAPVVIMAAIASAVVAFQIWNVLAAVSIAIAITMAGVCFAIQRKPYYRRTRCARVQEFQAIILLANAIVALVIAIVFDNVL